MNLRLEGNIARVNGSVQAVSWGVIECCDKYYTVTRHKPLPGRWQLNSVRRSAEGGPGCHDVHWRVRIEEARSVSFRTTE